MLRPEMAPPISSPCLEWNHVFFLLLKFGCLNVGVLSSVLVEHGVVGSTLTVIWIGVLPYVPDPRPLFFLSYFAQRISSIISIA
jgi:hypothetical protein